MRKEPVAIYDLCPSCAIEMDADWLQEAGVPSNMTHCAFTNWKPRGEPDGKLLESVREFSRQRMGVLVLLGPDKGIGKTHLSIAVLRARHCGFMVTHYALMRAIRKAYGDHHAPDMEARCKAARLLVIDEIGATTGGRDELPVINDIINHRIAEKKQTVLNGNLTLPEFQAVVGERVFDRLNEAAWKIWRMEGKSMRPERREDYWRK